jgi:hypothetical protein
LPSGQVKIWEEIVQGLRVQVTLGMDLEVRFTELSGFKIRERALKQESLEC